MSLAARPIPDSVLDAAARCLRVLAHPHRLRIVDLLDSHKSMSVGALADALDLPPAAVSQHLNHMRAHHLLDPERDGREVFYRIANPHVLSVLRCIRKHGGGR